MPIAAATSAALIGAGGAAASAFSQGNQNRKNRQWTEDMNSLQYSRNVDFWNMQNEYNSPQAQMGRFKEGGLNPHLIYGNGTSSAGNAGSIQTPDIQPYQHRSPNFDSATNIARSYIHDIADLDIKQAQHSNLLTDNTNKIKQGMLLDAQTGQSRFDLQFAKKLEQTNADALKQQVKNLETQQRYTLDKNEREIAMNSANLQESAERILKIRSDTANSTAQRRVIHEQMKSLQKDNTLKQLSVDLKKMGIESHDPWHYRVLARILGNKGNIIEYAKKQQGDYKR